MTDVDCLDLLSQELGFVLKLEQREALELLLRGKDVFCVLQKCEALALRARTTLTARFTDFFTDFEKKTDCFAVYFRSHIFFFFPGRGFM